MAWLSVFTIILLFYSLHQVASETYYIKANPTDLCTSPCLTLSQFVDNSSHLLNSNITLVFSPGIHYLNVSLTVPNLSYFSMTSEVQHLTAQIRCAHYSQIIFSQSQNILITNMEFVGCGGNQVVNVDRLVVHDSSFRGHDQENSGMALELIEATAEIINCTFSLNRYGAIIAAHSDINISQSIFEKNGAHHFNLHNGAIFVEQQSIINIIACAFVSNSAQIGVIYSRSCSITIKMSEFYGNNVSYGGVLTSDSSMIEIELSIFKDNIGSALVSDISIVKINTSEFYDNDVSYDGVLISDRSETIIEQSIFKDNIGTAVSTYNCTVKIKTSNFFRVVLTSYSSDITIEQSVFEYNIIYNNDPNSLNGVLISQSSSVTIVKSKFCHNYGIILIFTNNRNSTIDESEFRNNTGSVILSSNSNVVITTSEFDNNTEAGYFLLEQGMILGTYGGTIMINDSNFTNNNGPVIMALSSIIEHHNSLQVVNNSAENGYAIVHLYNSEFIGHHSGNAIVSSNLRSLVAFTSNITFMGIVEFSNNEQSQLSTDKSLQEGGAITLVQSNIYFDGTCRLENNHAENGGAIFSIGSKLYVKGNVTVAHNTASRNGGGVYLTESELQCLNKSIFILLNNTATHKGGGLHAISSFIKAMSILKVTRVETATLNFTNNVAEKGGGLSLEANAKLVILKYEYGDIIYGYYFTYRLSYTVMFSANSAGYGGAVYVDDDTNSGTCTGDPKTECFFQCLAYIHGLYGPRSIPDSTLNNTRNYLKTQSLYFSNNNASISGSTLYGGLLDRCSVSQFAEVRIKYEEDYEDGGNGITYFKHVSTITDNMSISSHPVQVCLCIDNEYNCTHQSHFEVKKGETFTVALASIDEIGQPVNGLIHASFKFAGSAVASGQATREIPAQCTNLTFNVVSPHSSEQFSLYALDGPCKDVNLSKISLELKFLPCSCPIGLQILGTNETYCTCECHETIRQYVEECDSYTGAFLRKSQSKAWIAFTNSSQLSGYLVYPNSPFDYCNSLALLINLNQPNGADKQCAFNRSSLLCGSCQPDLSLSLGSSRCLSCPNDWPALLIIISMIAILAGIALVALLLVLNMTVAVGTLNGLIFYANVVYANKSILFPFQETNFITVFISWLNLELEIDVCYFPGMDTYGKTWLQLTFPAYIILLVVLVIIISSYSSKFSNLIGKKNPVATLATLILLSYAKLLEVCFKSLSFGNLHYPDGSVRSVWLPDATVTYLFRKHILLFLTTILILLVGLFYTVLLFSWQWLLHLPRWRIFRWSRDQRLQTFIETYHTPYTPKHRYWTGLLLLARAILYLVAAVNITNDPTIALTAIVFTVCCISILKGFIGSRVYRKWPVDVLETCFYLNLLTFATFTWYCLRGECRNKKAAAYISVTTTFIILLLIILYHVYTYSTLFSKVEKIVPIKMLKKLFISANDTKEKQNLPPDDDDHRFHELLDIIDCPINTNDGNVPLKRVEPTCSVVEVHKPHVTPSNPDETNAQNKLNIDTEIEINK